MCMAATAIGGGVCAQPLGPSKSTASASSDTAVTARTKMQCRVQADGTLADCRLLSEEPKGQGFGDAALRMAKLYHMKLVSADGRSTIGAIVTVPIAWKTAPPPAPK